MQNFREGPSRDGSVGAGWGRATTHDGGCRAHGHAQTGTNPLFPSFKRFKFARGVIYLLTGRNALKTKFARKICVYRKYVVSLQPNSKTAKQ